MRILKHVLSIVLALVMLSLLMVTDIPRYISMTVMLICIFGIAWLKRGTFYYADANNKIYNKDSAKADRIIKRYKQALKAGISYRKMLTAGVVLIQHGDKEEGRKALHDIEEHSNDQALVNQARINLALSYYMDGELDDALDLTDRARGSVYRDKNFYVNACTFYLKAGRLEDFATLVDEFRGKDTFTNSPVMNDLIAVDWMLRGNWKKAGSILSPMINKGSYNFADPYVHLAQVKMHYGLWQEAIDMFNLAIEKSMFTPGCIIGEECCEKSIAFLKDEAVRDMFIAGNENDPLALVNGELPDLLSTDERRIEAEPEWEKIAEDASETEEEIKDAATVDTDLTDDDDEWLKKHGL